VLFKEQGAIPSSSNAAVMMAKFTAKTPVTMTVALLVFDTVGNPTQIKLMLQ